jgi:hypothetical protein
MCGYRSIRDYSVLKILFDEGRRYPAAQVTGEEHILVMSGDSGVMRDPRPFCNYDRGHAPASWGATASTGVWRTFSELALGDPEQITAFLRRWGDPTDDVPRDPDYICSTASWSNFQGVIRIAARSWDPPQADGVSEFSPRRAREVNVQLLASFSPTLLDSIAPAVLSDGTLGFRAKNLHGYLTGTAILAVQEKIPMRRCDYCSGWYEVRRRGGQYCSATCRATAHAAARGTV